MLVSRIFCLFTCAAQAEEAVELEKTVVTATRTETPIENLPVSVTVITKDDIENMRAKTVDDVLNKAVSINVRRCKGLADTGHTTIGMRGLGRDTSRILFLKDGIPLNNTYMGSTGNFWDVLSVNDIEKIEIVRGASSALYGSSAMGGVINIIIRPVQLAYYLDEFTFRFNRRKSKARGLLFYRLMEHAVECAPVPRPKIVGG